jgi:hypothetical protein
MKKWAGIFIVFSLVTTRSAQAGTVYHFDLLNQNGTAGADGAPNGYAGSFTTFLNPANRTAGRSTYPNRALRASIQKPG